MKLLSVLILQSGLGEYVVQNNKMNAVVIVAMIILLGMFLLMLRIEKKTRDLEDKDH